jgi:CheY-like chemotaxis protein
MYRNLGILVCDDSPDDCYFLKRAFLHAGINARFETVNSAQGAMEYLLGKGGFSDRQVPALMLLDVKMPGMDGFDVLKWVRNNPDLRSLPVVMLSSSDIQKDVDKAFELGCNAYTIKPIGPDNMEKFVRSIETFWLQHGKYPSCCGETGALC